MENTVEFADFRQLLETVENTDIAIRLRVSGEPWTQFSKLILLSDTAMILQNGVDTKIIVHIRNVIEFEINYAYAPYKAHTTYEVRL